MFWKSFNCTLLLSFFYSILKESFLPLIPTLKSLLVSANSSAQAVTDGKETQSLSNCKREILQLLLKRFTVAVAPAVDKGTDALDALLLALKCPSSLGVLASGNTVQMQVIEQVWGFCLSWFLVRC